MAILGVVGDAMLASIFPPYGLFSALTNTGSTPVTSTTPSANPYVPVSAANPSMNEAVGVSLNVQPGITTGISNWVNANTNTVMILLALVGTIIFVVPAFTGRTGRRS